MSQAITTTYHSGNVTAKSFAGYVRHSYDHSLSGEENHKAAALKLMKKFRWAGIYHSGTLKRGALVWVQIDTTFPLTLEVK